MMYDKINEIQIQLYLKHNIQLKDSYEKLSTLINYSMNKSTELSILHNEVRIFKHYSFSGLYPIEKDMIYKSDEVYNLLIRSYKKDLIKNLQLCLDGLENDDFVVIGINEIKTYGKSNIEYVDTITPTIVTIDNRCWNILKDQKEYFDNAIINNMVKKYNDLQGINQQFNSSDIIDRIEIKNRYAIVTNYKGVKLLGYKVRIYFKDNNISQELANLSIADGVGEKNSSLGQGFVKPYFRRVAR